MRARNIRLLPVILGHVISATFVSNAAGVWSATFGLIAVGS